MREKKGFTLVEILGVIIVIGIILVVAIPSITGYIATSKKKTYVETVNSYIRAVKSKVGSFSYRFDDEKYVYYIPISCIPSDRKGESPYGDIQEAYVVVINDNGDYRYYWTSYDNSGYGISLTQEKDLKDVTIETNMHSIDKTQIVDGKVQYMDMDDETCSKRPVISKVNVGYQIYPNKETYTTGGISEVSGTITTTNNDPYIDFSGLKKYSSVGGVVIYLTNNATENIPVTIYTREETYNMTKGIRGVIKSGEKEARIEIPEGSYNGIRVDIGERSGLSYQIERIELVIEDQTGVYTNKDVTLYVGGIKEEEGVYEYSFDNGVTWVNNPTKRYTKNKTEKVLIKDIIGSKSEVKNVSINMIDRINPGCSLKASGTLGDNGWHKSEVKVSFATKTDSKNSDYSASGVKKATLESETGLDIYTQTEDIATKTIIGYVEDNAGNKGQCNITIKRDTKAPTCTNSGDSTSWALSRTINYGCSDTLSGCNTSYSGGSKSFTTTTKTSVISAYEIRDKAGNKTSCPARTANVYVDKTGPTCVTTGGSSNWVKGTVIVTGNCTDSESGCSTASISKTLSDTTNSMETPGVISDALGNATTCPTTRVMIDNTPPACTWESDGWKTTITVTATASDEHSGISGNTTQSESVSSTGNISKIFSDVVGNTATCSTIVESRKEYRKRECDTCKRCSDASCETWNSYTYSGVCKCTNKVSGSPSSTDCNSSIYSSGCNSYCASINANPTVADNVCDRSRTCKTRAESCSSCGCEDWKSWESWTTTVYSKDSNTDAESRTTYNIAN